MSIAIRAGIAGMLAALCLAGNVWAGGLTLSADRLEFGKMKEGLVAKKVITLTNNGATAAKIANVTTSWSCTSTALGQRELKAGEKTGLTIIYNTWKFPGKFEKFVYVFSGPKGQQKQTITVTGFVEPVPMAVVTVSPRKLSAGVLPLGKASRRDLVIKNTGDAVLNVQKVVSKKFRTVYFDAAKAGKPLSIAPGKNALVALELKPAKAGRYLDYVLIYGEARNITKNGYKVVVLGKAQ